MELMNPNSLKPHPRNGEFFDDMEGQKWKDFLQSVKTSGVIEPIIVTQDLVIVSGHQRIRAAKELELESVAVEVRHYEDKDKVLKDLIETNIMQRGIGNTNPIKLAKCIVELERIEGIRNGGDRKSESHNVTLTNQSNLAEQLKMSKMQLSRYKRLLDLIPELQEAIESGKVSATAANGVLSRLSEEEQAKVADTLSGINEKVSQKRLEAIAKQLSDKEEENKRLRYENAFLKDENEEYKNTDPVYVEKVVEVVPSDVKSRLEKAEREREGYKADYEKQKQVATEQMNRNLELQNEIEELKSATKEGIDSKNLSENVYYFCSVCNNFIGNVGGLVWLTDRIANMPEKERELFLKAARSFCDWSEIFKSNLERSVNDENGNSNTNTGIPVLAD